MSSFLYRLGRFAVGSARWVVAAWLMLLILAAGSASLLGGHLQQDLSIPGTESQRGLDTLDHRFPLLAGTSAQVLFVAPEGEQVADHRAEVRRVLGRVADVDHVARVVDPFAPGSEYLLSADGHEALAQVLLDEGLDELDDQTVTDLEDAAEVSAASPLDVHLGGSIFTTTKVSISATEGLGVVIAMVVLAMTFASVLAAGLPILTALVGVGTTMLGLLAVAAFTTVNSTTPTLALMIGLAVGIDYALFIVFRHRTQLATGMAVEDSVARSVATAGSAVIFAGTTVIIALCGLVVVGIPGITVMGFAAAAGVAIAVAVALTLVPAILALAGERLRPRPGSRAARHGAVAGSTGATAGHSMGARWVRGVTRAPVLTVVLTTAVLVVLALPARDLDLGLPDRGSDAPGSSSRVTYDLVSDAYGPGWNSPLLVTVDIIRTTDPVGVVEGLAADLGRLDGVAAVPLATPNPGGDLGVIQVVPETGQTDPATADLVREIRDRSASLEEEYGVTDLEVTGQTAVTIDVSERLSGALLPFGLVVVGLSLLLLMIVFRSVAVPVKATLGYVLSVAASFGAVAAVFEWGWFADTLGVSRLGPVISFLPIILMGVLFGLAMDYEVFLVSRMHEDYMHGGDARGAVVSGFTASARVVAAAAIIMFSVFAAFVPHGDAIVKPIALGLAVGVFVDAFLVRMTLVPAVLALLGDRAWWLPRWLDQRVPPLDVEGAGLLAHLEHEAWVREHGAAAVRAEAVGIADERGRTVLAPISLVVRSGTLAVAATDDPTTRAALLAALAGRLPITDGVLVVQDRVLPAEAVAVRARVWHLPEFPDAGTLDRIAAAAAGGAEVLAVVDRVDEAAAPVQQDRWRRLLELTDLGATVVAGASAAPDVPHQPLRPVPAAEKETVS
ncbi:MMPL family transporter [Nocardioides sp.]|uniref:MMPL family transporter n=1 Tax=Nocardioides sp. TaxID=35761 RepID=UPI002ED7B457